MAMEREPPFSAMASCLLQEASGKSFRTAVAISPTRAVTYRHGHHKLWRAGDEITYRAHDGLDCICRVEAFDDDLDLTVLSGSFTHFPPGFVELDSEELPYNYWMMSFTGINGTLFTSGGMISSHAMDRCRILGSLGAWPEDAGGGVFDVEGAFVGMFLSNFPAKLCEASEVPRALILPAELILDFVRS